MTGRSKWKMVTEVLDTLNGDVRRMSKYIVKEVNEYRIQSLTWEFGLEI